MKKNRGLRNFTILVCVVIALIVGANLYFDAEESQNLQAKSAVPGHITQKAVSPNIALKDSIVNFGMGLLGTPYLVAGGTPQGFDCSGYVNYVFTHFNIDVPRSSAAFEHFGTEIELENVQKGDLLLFLSPTRDVIGHMGIVSKANGKRSDFIHSSSGREMKVIETSLTNPGYTKRFVKAIRVL